MALEGCLDTYGSSGFSFRRPSGTEEAAPAAAAVPEEAPPNELMNMDILLRGKIRRFKVATNKAVQVKILKMLALKNLKHILKTHCFKDTSLYRYYVAWI